MGKDSFLGILNDLGDEIIQDSKNKVQKAYEGIKAEIENKIADIIQKEMLDNYYGGYDPNVYDRTYQLDKSVAPLIFDVSENDDLQFSFGVKITPPNGPNSMHHVKVVMFGSNSGRFRPDEKKIFNNFMLGEHPNAKEECVTDTPTRPVWEAANQAIDKLLSNGVIDKIIRDAFSQ